MCSLDSVFIRKRGRDGLIQLLAKEPYRKVPSVRITPLPPSLEKELGDHMSISYKLGRYCPTCNTHVSDRNKSGFCNRHRDRTGDKNPFFGKRHKKEVVDNAKLRQSLISKSLWEDLSYREKVIKGISKPRRVGFKKEQSLRIKKWFLDNPEQGEIRCSRMTELWRDGTLKINRSSIRSSKIELVFIKDLKNIYDVEVVTLKLGTKTFFPDTLCLRDMIIIEFFGNFWHANPDIYSKDDVIFDGITAKDIWLRDKERIDFLKKSGYDVYVVLEKDYRDNPELTISKFDFLNWESCSF